MSFLGRRKSFSPELELLMSPPPPLVGKPSSRKTTKKKPFHRVSSSSWNKRVNANRQHDSERENVVAHHSSKTKQRNHSKKEISFVSMSPPLNTNDDYQAENSQNPLYGASPASDFAVMHSQRDSSFVRELDGTFDEGLSHLTDVGLSAQQQHAGESSSHGAKPPPMESEISKLAELVANLSAQKEDLQRQVVSLQNEQNSMFRKLEARDETIAELEDVQNERDQQIQLLQSQVSSLSQSNSRLRRFEEELEICMLERNMLEKDKNALAESLGSCLVKLGEISGGRSRLEVEELVESSKKESLYPRAVLNLSVGLGHEKGKVSRIAAQMKELSQSSEQQLSSELTSAQEQSPNAREIAARHAANHARDEEMARKTEEIVAGMAKRYNASLVALQEEALEGIAKLRTALEEKHQRMQSMDAEVHKMDALNSSLALEVAELQSQLALARKDMTSAEQARKEAVKLANVSSGRWRMLEEHIEKLEAKCRAATEQSEVSQKEVDTLIHQLKEARAQSKHAESANSKELSSVRKQCAQLSDELTTTTAALGSSEQACRKLQAQAKDLDARATSADEEKAVAVAETKALSAQLVAAKKTISSQQQEIEKTHKKLQDSTLKLRGAKAELETQNHRLVQDLAAAEADIKSANESVQLLEAALENERCSCASLQEKLGESENTIALQGAELSSIKRSLEEGKELAALSQTERVELRSTLDATSARLEQANLEVQKLSSDLEHVSGSKETLKEECKAAVAVNSTLQQELESVRIEQHKMSSDYDALEQSLESLKDENESLSHKVRCLEEDLGAANTRKNAEAVVKNKLESELAISNSKLNMTKNVLDRAVLERKDLAEQVASLTSKLTSTDNKLVAANERVDELTRSNEESNKHCRALQTRCDALEMEHEALLSENSQLSQEISSIKEETKVVATARDTLREQLSLSTNKLERAGSALISALTESKRLRAAPQEHQETCISRATLLDPSMAQDADDLPTDDADADDPHGKLAWHTDKEMQDLIEQVETLQREVDSNSTENLAKLESKIVEKESFISTLRLELENCMLHLMQISGRLQQADEDIAQAETLTADVETLDADRRDLRDQLLDKETLIAHLEAELIRFGLERRLDDEDATFPTDMQALGVHAAEQSEDVSQAPTEANTSADITADTSNTENSSDDQITHILQ